MSKYYGYKCKQCGTVSHHWMDDGHEGLLRQLRQNFKSIKAFLELLGKEALEPRVRLQIVDQDGDDITADVLTFLYDHEGHNLVLHEVDETTYAQRELK